MFNTEIKVEGTHVKGTIKRATRKTLSEIDVSRMNYQQKREWERKNDAEHPYTFHGSFSNSTMDNGRATWTPEQLRKLTDELTSLQTKLDEMNGEIKAAEPSTGRVWDGDN